MVGVFDSGVGGLSAVAELRRLAPMLDICFLADRENAPYGTKSQEELVCLVAKNIYRLQELGATKILIACCSASSIYEYLPKEAKDLSYPIIIPTAKAAASITENGCVGVIATEATVASGIFTKELKKSDRITYVFELATQKLVSLVEEGACDGNIKYNETKAVENLLSPLKEKNIDTLILGCTHFPHLTKTISSALPGVKTVSSSKEGAKAFLSSVNELGCGKTVYI